MPNEATETPEAAAAPPAEARAAARRVVDEPKVRLRVRRQDRSDRPETRRTEEFEVDGRAGMTVLDALAALRRSPTTADGRAVAPVAFEGSCREGTCGGCTMLIGGVARLACTTLVRDASRNGKPIVVAPLSRFPVVRDLIVDRARFEESVARVGGFIVADDRGASPAPTARVNALRFALAACNGCGACLEACPQWGEHSDFVGPAALAAARSANLHPVGALDRDARLDAVMQPGGVSDCGKAQSCVEVCPSGVPLTEAMGDLARDVTLRWLFGR